MGRALIPPFFKGGEESPCHFGCRFRESVKAAGYHTIEVKCGRFRVRGGCESAFMLEGKAANIIVARGECNGL